MEGVVVSFPRLIWAHGFGGFSLCSVGPVVIGSGSTWQKGCPVDKITPLTAKKWERVRFHNPLAGQTPSEDLPSRVYKSEARTLAYGIGGVGCGILGLNPGSRVRWKLPLGSQEVWREPCSFHCAVKCAVEKRTQPPFCHGGKLRGRSWPSDELEHRAALF